MHMEHSLGSWPSSHPRRGASPALGTSRGCLPPALAGYTLIKPIYAFSNALKIVWASSKSDERSCDILQSLGCGCKAQLPPAMFVIFLTSCSRRTPAAGTFAPCLVREAAGTHSANASEPPIADSRTIVRTRLISVLSMLPYR